MVASPDDGRHSDKPDAGIVRNGGGGGSHGGSKHEEKEPRTIDNIALAALLRQSADYVERGEFHGVMYEALQDFRAYYKQKFPKGKNDAAGKKGKRRKKPGFDAAAAAAKLRGNSTNDVTGNVESYRPPSATRTTSDPTVSEVSASEPSSDQETETEEHAEFKATAFPLPPFAAAAAASSTSTSSRPTTDPSPTYSATNGTGNSDPSPKGFGSFKFPKLHVPLPNAQAFGATSRKNAQRAKDDVDQIQQGAKLDALQATESQWCEEHFCMGCACQVRKFEAGSRTDAKILESQRSTKSIPMPVADPPPQTTTDTAHGSAGSGSFSSPPSATTPSATVTDNPARTNSASGSTASAASAQTMNGMAQPRKPAFQRPLNPNSTLIANGWIEQQRRSKMRIVWKDVLASLVEGRKPGEETTLWIQREVINPSSGKQELEALHQIPMKCLQAINFSEYSPEHRFSLKAFNLPDDFVFKCSSGEAAREWVVTLRSAQAASQGRRPSKSPAAAVPTTPLDEWDKRSPSFDEEKKLSDRQVPTPTHQTTPQQSHQPAPQTQTQPNVQTPQTQVQTPTGPQQSPYAQQNPQQPQQRYTIRELRAIAHGAGISTVGMERPELEKAAREVLARGTYFEPPRATTPTAGACVSPANHPDDEDLLDQDTSKIQEELNRQEEVKQKEELIRQEELRKQELRRQQAEADEAKRRQQQEEEARLRAETERKAEEARRIQAEEEARRLKAMEEEHRRRLAEEEQRKRLAEEEQRRRLAEEEQRRRIAEQQAAEQRRRQEEALRAQQQQWAQQQQAWAKQQQEEEQRRQAAEREAAEQRRRQEEAYRKQQQWHQAQQAQQQQQQWQQQQQQQQRYAQQQQQHPQQRYQQQQHPQQSWHQQHPHQSPPPHQHHQQHRQNQQHQHPNSAVNQKYAQMANQQEANGQAVITRIKHDILIHWALQPPMLQTLRPIDVLITSIHSVFPPALGVPGHDYFQKWKPVTVTDVHDEHRRPDDDKLKKAVRKIRFFLHPDKLPKDLTTEQQFMVKMLWDITSDAWEEFHKKNEELDWINK